MNALDKQELKEMLGELKNHLTDIRKLENESILTKLTGIHEQVKEINDTQRRHTDQIGTLERNLPHTILNCPQNDKLEALWEKKIISIGVRKWTVGVLTLLGMLVGALASVVAILVFFKP